MPHMDFWSYVTSPGFLIMFGLTLGTFAPIAYSVYVTWDENKYKVEQLREEKRQMRRQRRAR